MAPHWIISRSLLIGFVSITNCVIFKGGRGTGTPMTELYGDGWISMGNISTAVAAPSSSGDTVLLQLASWSPMTPQHQALLSSHGTRQKTNAGTCDELRCSPASHMDVEICKKYCTMTGLWGKLWTEEEETSAKTAHGHYMGLLENRKHVLATKVAGAHTRGLEEQTPATENPTYTGNSMARDGELSAQPLNHAVEIEQVIHGENSPASKRTAPSRDGWVYIAELVALGPYTASGTTRTDGDKPFHLGGDLAQWGIPDEDHPLWQKYKKILKDIETQLDKEKQLKQEKTEKSLQGTERENREKNTRGIVRENIEKRTRGTEAVTQRIEEVSADGRAKLKSLAEKLTDKEFSDRGLPDGRKLVESIERLHNSTVARVEGDATSTSGTRETGTVDTIRTQVDALLQLKPKQDDARNKWKENVRMFCVVMIAYGTKNVFGETPVPPGLQDLHASALEMCEDGASNRWYPEGWNFKDSTTQVDLNKLTRDKVFSDAVKKAFTATVEDVKRLDTMEDSLRAYDAIHTLLWALGDSGTVPAAGTGKLPVSKHDPRTLMAELKEKVDKMANFRNSGSEEKHQDVEEVKNHVQDLAKQRENYVDDTKQTLKETLVAKADAAAAEAAKLANEVKALDEAEIGDSSMDPTNNPRNTGTFVNKKTDHRRAARTASATHSKEKVERPPMRRLLRWALRPIGKAIRRSLRD